MKVIAIVPIIFILVGCASKPKLYGEAALTYSLHADYWLESEREWQCDPPGFDAEVGLEWDNGAACAIYHRSFLRCGGFNDRPETWDNGIRCRKKWGGF